MCTCIYEHFHIDEFVWKSGWCTRPSLLFKRIKPARKRTKLIYVFNDVLDTPKMVKRLSRKLITRCMIVLRRGMVFNATFNNISFISWRSVLLVDETGVPRENHRPVTSHWQTSSHNVISGTPCHERYSNSQRWYALIA